MFIDKQLPAASAVACSGNSETVIGDVYNAGSAKKLFGGGRGGGPKGAVTITAVGGTNPTSRVKLVGADSSDLATNPITIADTGTSRVLVSGDLPVIQELNPSEQLDAKQYYGFTATLGGTSPTATITANVVPDVQSAGFH